MNRKIALALCLALLLGATAQAKDWFVNPATGTDAWPAFGSSPATPFKTITFAVGGGAPVAPGDRIICAPGLYDSASGEAFPIPWNIPDVQILGTPGNPLACTIATPAGYGGSVVVANLAPHTPFARLEGFSFVGDCFNGIFISGPAAGVLNSPTIANNLVAANVGNCAVSLSSSTGPHAAEVTGNYVSGGAAAAGLCVFGIGYYGLDVVDTNQLVGNAFGQVMIGLGGYPSIAAPLMRSNVTRFSGIVGTYSYYSYPQMIQETVTVNGVYGILAIGAGVGVTNPSVLNSVFQYHAADLYGIGPATTYYMAGSNWATVNVALPYVLTINGNPLAGVAGVGIAPDAYHLLPGSPLIDAGWAPPAAPLPFFPGYVDFFGRSIWGSTDIDGESRFSAGAPGGVAFIDVGADEVDPVAACRVGTVNDLTGPITDVLFVNGTNGGNLRETVEDSSQWLNVYMTPPPVPLNNKYYAAVWAGVPSATTIDTIGDLGLSCFQPVIPKPLYTPPIAAAVANTAKPASPKVDPPGAFATGDALPGNILEIPPGTFAPGATLTVQGVILDGNTSATSNPGSVTNAVVVWMN